jgi:maleate cis-trans isomerase
MAYDCWRGMVGIIKPTKGSSSLVELIKMLPDGIGVIPLFNNIRHGKIEEFQAAIPAYEEKIAELAEDGVDLIHPAGTPPFMLLGYRREAELIAQWEKRFGIPIFTSATNQVAAMKALRIKKFVGIGYDFDDTSIVARYFTDAGFDVLGIEKLPGAWEEVGRLSSKDIYHQTRNLFLKHVNADGIYFQGGKLRILDMIEPLEQDLGVPVIHPGVAQCWEIQRRLHVREPRTGYGRLLAELPTPPV